MALVAALAATALVVPDVLDTSAVKIQRHSEGKTPLSDMGTFLLGITEERQWDNG